MERFKKILLVLNPESEELVALARAVSLARQNRARLHVVVVLEHLPLDELPLGTRTLLGILDRDGLREMIVQRQRRLLRSGLSELSTDVDIEEHENAVVALHRERLEALLEAYPVPGQRAHMEEGFPGEIIPLVARRERIDLIVMGTVARVGIPGLFIGNTAERTLDHVDCDILAVKPKGFVAPVCLPGE